MCGDNYNNFQCQETTVFILALWNNLDIFRFTFLLKSLGILTARGEKDKCRQRLLIDFTQVSLIWLFSYQIHNRYHKTHNV